MAYQPLWVIQYHTHTHILYIYIYIYIYMFADRNRGCQKALFSKATTPRGREGRNSVPWIAPLTLDPDLINQGDINYHFF